jgi:hypothetical protein
MATCNATVTVDGFEATGSITFRVQVSDCEHSSGQFRFDYQVKKPSGNEMITDRTANWTNSDDAVFTFDDSLNLPADYELLDVEIDDASVNCTCLDK